MAQATLSAREQINDGISFAEPTGFITEPLGEGNAGLESLQKRNHTALGVLMERHIDRYLERLLALAKMFVPNETEAEEVVQEMWGRILEDVQQGEGRSSLEILIFQILTKRSETPRVQERWENSHYIHELLKN